MGIFDSVRQRVEYQSSQIHGLSLEEAKTLDYSGWKQWIEERMRASGRGKEFSINFPVAIQLIKRFIEGTSRMYLHEVERFDEVTQMQLPLLVLSNTSTGFSGEDNVINLSISQLEEYSGYKPHEKIQTYAKDGTILQEATNLDIYYIDGMEEIHHAIDYFRHPERKHETSRQSESFQEHESLEHEKRARAMITAILKKDGAKEELIKLNRNRLLSSLGTHRE